MITHLEDFRHPNFKLKIKTSLGYLVTIFVGADDNDGYAIYRYDPFGAPWSHHWDSGVLFYDVSKDGVIDDDMLTKLAPYNNKKSFWLIDTIENLDRHTRDQLIGSSIKDVDVTYYYKYAFGMTIRTNNGMEIRVGTEGIYENLHDYDVLSRSWFEHMMHGIDIYDVIVDGKSNDELLSAAKRELKSMRRDYRCVDSGCDSSDDDD